MQINSKIILSILLHVEICKKGMYVQRRKSSVSISNFTIPYRKIVSKDLRMEIILRALVITTVFVTKDFAVNSNLLL